MENKHLVYTPTSRGFRRYDFIDRYGASCSLQESSVAEFAAVWLGPNDNRMHLTQGMVKEMLPLLMHFAETGDLPKPEKPDITKEIPFMRELLDKHSQLMRMYLRDNNFKQAAAQFEIIKPLFSALSRAGEIMRYYTVDDFTQDSALFEK